MPLQPAFCPPEAHCGHNGTVTASADGMLRVVEWSAAARDALWVPLLCTA